MAQGLRNGRHASRIPPLLRPMNQPSISPDPPRLDAAEIHRRLDAIRQALGADRAVVARRVPAVDRTETRFEVLAQAAPTGAVRPPGLDVPLDFLDELFRDGRARECGRHSHDPARRADLVRRGLTWMGGWPLPSDRWPSIVVLAWCRRRRDPGTIRRQVAEAGMEALARALAPPPWVPLDASRATSRAPDAGRAGSRGPDGPNEDGSLAGTLARVERDLILRAMQAAEGNKAAAARSLALSRQGLYRKLRRHGLLAAPRRPRQ